MPNNQITWNKSVKKILRQRKITIVNQSYEILVLSYNKIITEWIKDYITQYKLKNGVFD